MRISDWSSDVCSSDLKITSRNGHCSFLPCLVRACELHPPPGLAVEEVHEVEAWSQPDLLARPEVMALAEFRHYLTMADTREDLRLGAGRLDDDALRLETDIRERQMLRSDSVDGRMPIPRTRRADERQTDAGCGTERRTAGGQKPDIDKVT